MAGWAQVRQTARAQVQQAFALHALYFVGLNIGVGRPVSVRIRSKVVQYGDLQNEGFSRTNDDTKVAVFLAADVARLTIKKGGILAMADGRYLRLAVRNAVLDDFTVEYQVTQVGQA